MSPGPGYVPGAGLPQRVVEMFAMVCPHRALVMNYGVSLSRATLSRATVLTGCQNGFVVDRTAASSSQLGNFLQGVAVNVVIWFNSPTFVSDMTIGSIADIGFTTVVTSVPEPSSMRLSIVCILGAAARLSRSKSRSPCVL